MSQALQQNKFKAGRIVLPISATVACLTLAAEPFGLWYLAWFALVPWLIVVGRAATVRAAMFRGWLAGVFYFAANLWWLWTASIPGTVVLILYFALFWAIAAGVIHALKLLASDGSEPKGAATVYHVFATATIWVAAEWLRCYVASGFPWMPLGSTQSSIPIMCQVADIGGPWIVSFWVALPNAVAATAWLSRGSPTHSGAAVVAVVATLAVVVGYGAWRLQTTTTIPGPSVMLVQSNFHHLPGGAPTVDREHAVDFYISELQKDLAQQRADLVVLPEAAFPPLNDEARRELARSPVGPFLENTLQRLSQIANDHRTAILFGGTAVTGWSTHGSEHTGAEIRNSAYFLDPRSESTLARYDKVYLARFSERAPLTIGPAWLRQLAKLISAQRAVQPMFAGSLSDLRPFKLVWSDANSAVSPRRESGAQFITPICLENIDPPIMATMVRGSSPTFKQADFIANISNDGWFADQEKYQHLQTTVFRCIENRVPMIRCSNTGISALIDSTGRVQQAIAPSTAGFLVGRIESDGRRTFYTHYGDVFAVTCVLLAALAATTNLIAFGRRMRAQNRAMAAKKRE